MTSVGVDLDQLPSDLVCPACGLSLRANVATDAEKRRSLQRAAAAGASDDECAELARWLRLDRLGNE
jgi:hypothetical protein